jgi:hypothetical protein
MKLHEATANSKDETNQEKGDSFWTSDASFDLHLKCGLTLWNFGWRWALKYSKKVCKHA